MTRSWYSPGSINDAALSRTSEPPVVGFGVPVAVTPLGRSAKNKSTGRGTPRGNTRTNIAADEPMLTETRGDGICKSKSNGATLATEVGEGATVVAGMVVVTIVVVLVGSGASKAGGARVVGTVVVGGVGSVPSTTLFRFIVVVGKDFGAGFATGLFPAATFTTAFLGATFFTAFVIATLLSAATDAGAAENESALSNKNATEEAATPRAIRRFRCDVCILAFGQRRRFSVNGELSFGCGETNVYFVDHFNTCTSY